jgi:hypothetical protein
LVEGSGSYFQMEPTIMEFLTTASGENHYQKETVFVVDYFS